ncbi:MAG: hypothetical protein QGH33_18320 [Pirellulaceae bacterium]|jgi:Fe-S-cluster containining protein|nr:hypothetical protein [Pirellulaceae bacterium]MDP7304635.1 hypothetical protein [Pirellulaceae bacterium]HJN12968.1 hypothetical protein [Pirellulaceae bacterium]
MFVTLTIVLAVAILVIVAVLCLMFLSVAFSGPPAVTVSATKESSAAKEPWQPPLDNDDTLVRWATRVAANVTTNRLSMARSRSTATELAQELYTGTSEALQQLREEKAQCPARCHEMVGATAPEVLAVADSMHAQLCETEVDRIRRAAETNLMQTRTMSRQEYASADITCPLLTNGGTCAVYVLRPLFCRMDGPVCGRDDSSEQQRLGSSSSLAIGIGKDLSNGLAAVGVDANRYELNSALLVALYEPTMSARWASGEPTFAKCKQFCA